MYLKMQKITIFSFFLVLFLQHIQDILTRGARNKFIRNESAVRNLYDLHQEGMKVLWNLLRNRKSQRGARIAGVWSPFGHPVMTLLNQQGQILCFLLLHTWELQPFCVSKCVQGKLSKERPLHPCPRGRSPKKSREKNVTCSNKK